MGEVYRAVDAKLGREVALKILPAELAAHPEALRRFEQEARAASALNHPNIVTIYEIGETESMAWIAMELVDGDDLRTLAAREPLSLKSALRVAVKVADGLAAAHEKGIVHRDLKPDNVMVTPDGFVKILDFGLAKQLRVITSDDTTIPHTSPGAVFGTVGYMSPEQATGREMDYHSDQFSFGVMLYEMVTRVRPFDRETKPETMVAIIRDEVPPPSSHNEAVPFDLDRVVSRCLSKAPRDRYAATRDLARDLREIRDGITQTSARFRSGPPPGVRRARASRAVAAAVALALLGGAAFMWTRSSSERAPRAAVATATLGPDDQRRFNEAAALLHAVKDEKSVDVAIANLETVLRNARESGAVNALLARALLHKATLSRRPVLLEQATVYAARGVVFGPTEPDSHATLGRLQNASGRHGEAVRSFERALQLRPEMPDAILGLADAYAGLGRAAESERMYRKAVALRPDSAGYHSHFGGFWFAQGRYDEAIRHFQKSVELAPQLPNGYANLGGALHASGRYDEALRAYERSLAIKPTAVGWSNLGTLQFAMRRYAESQSSFRHAVELAPSDSVMWGNLADACLATRAPCAKDALPRAIANARDALTQNPGNAKTRALLAAALAKNGDLAAAQTEIRRALEADPTNATVLYQAAVVGTLRGRPDSALSWLERAVAAGYPAADAARDPLLEPIRKLPSFRAAVKSDA